MWCWHCRGKLPHNETNLHPRTFKQIIKTANWTFWRFTVKKGQTWQKWLSKWDYVQSGLPNRTEICQLLRAKQNLGRASTRMSPWRLDVSGMFSRLNMCRSQGAHDRILQGRQAEQTHLSLCSEVYDYQGVNGRHFHMEQPQGSEVFEQKRLGNVVNGTLRAVFDMCEVGKLKVPEGNNFLRKRSIVRTTSRELHETLDSRYCSKKNNHQPIEGSIRYLGRRNKSLWVCSSILQWFCKERLLVSPKKQGFWWNTIGTGRAVHRTLRFSRTIDFGRGA